MYIYTVYGKTFEGENFRSCAQNTPFTGKLWRCIRPMPLFVTESRKTVPNHTFFVHYIYYCNMNSITFSTLFHIITWNLMLKLSKLCNKYSGNRYA